MCASSSNLSHTTQFLGPLLETPFEADRATCIEIANWEAQHRAQQQAKSGGGGSASGASGPSSGGKKGAPAAAGGKKGAPAAGGGKKGAPASAATPGEGSSSDGGAQAQRGKREKKEKPKKEKPPAPADDISAFDIRVGVVLTAKFCGLFCCTAQRSLHQGWPLVCLRVSHEHHCCIDPAQETSWS